MTGRWILSLVLISGLSMCTGCHCLTKLFCCHSPSRSTCTSNCAASDAGCSSCSGAGCSSCASGSSCRRQRVATSGGSCKSCNLLPMLHEMFSCTGCGDTYWHKSDDPPDRCDPCDRYGNWTGRPHCSRGQACYGQTAKSAGRALHKARPEVIREVPVEVPVRALQEAPARVIHESHAHRLHPVPKPSRSPQAQRRRPRQRRI